MANRRDFTKFTYTSMLNNPEDFICSWSGESCHFTQQWPIKLNKLIRLANITRQSELRRTSSWSTAPQVWSNRVCLDHLAENFPGWQPIDYTNPSHWLSTSTYESITDRPEDQESKATILKSLWPSPPYLRGWLESLEEFQPIPLGHQSPFTQEEWSTRIATLPAIFNQIPLILELPAKEPIQRKIIYFTRPLSVT